MKNKLLITTALVVLVSANNAFAQVRGDLIVDSETPISNQGMNEEPYYYKSIKVEKKGSLNIKTSDIKTERDITVLGKLDLKNSVLEAGNDADDQPNNSNISMDGATVTMNDSDLEANGNIIIKNTKLSSISSTEAPDNYGVWAAANLTLENSEVSLKDSYLSADGEIIVNSGTINVTGKQVEISSSKKVNLNGGTINIAKGNTLKIYSGNDKTPTPAQLGSAAILNIAGTLDAGLNGNGTVNFNSNSGKIIGNVNMTNGGVMNVGLNNAIIDGDAIFNSGSTLKLKITDSGNGSLQAANIISKVGAKLALGITKKMKIGETLEDIALLKGNVDNHFTNEISNNRYKVTSKDGKNFDITYENSASDVVADAGGTVNNAATAEAWDSVTTSSTASTNAKAVASVLNDLSQNNEQAYVDALTAVAPDVAPAVQQTSTETANQVFGAVGTRLSGGSVASASQGMSSGDNIFERAAMWVQGLFNKSKLDDTSKAKGFDAKTNGVAFGFEKFVTDDVKAGVGYAYSQTDIDGFMRDTDVDTHTAIVYGEYKPSNWYVNGIATYGWSDYEEKKNVAGVGVKADYDVETFGLQAMTGYDMNVNGLGITPEAGLRYVHIKQDAYKDSADQRVSGNNSDILTGVIGAKVSKNFELENGMNIKPEARIAATYDLMNDDVNSVVTLANGSAYSVNGEALERFGMEFGVGVTAEVNDKIELSLGYEGKFRKDYQDHTGLLNAKYKF